MQDPATSLGIRTQMFVKQPWVNPSTNNLNLVAANQHNETGEWISSVPVLQGPGSWDSSSTAPITQFHLPTRDLGIPAWTWLFHVILFLQGSSGVFCEPRMRPVLWLLECKGDGSHICASASQEGPWQGQGHLGLCSPSPARSPPAAHHWGFQRHLSLVCEAGVEGSTCGVLSPPV